MLDWLEPVIPPHQLCVCCAVVVYRPGATTGYDIVAAQPSRGGKQSSLQSCNVLHTHLASHSTITIF